jgi:hypothetical protein
MEKADITTRKRGRVAEILVEDAMSREESCVEEERLSWESSKLRRIKEALDKTISWIELFQGQIMKKNRQGCPLKGSLNGQFPRNDL